MQNTAGGGVMMGGVLRVLLSRSQTSDGDNTDTTNTTSGMSSSIADLLQAAPHCVPYSLRVDLFRELLKLDKVCAALVSVANLQDSRSSWTLSVC